MISSLPAYLDLVSEVRDAWFPREKSWGPWFRGQACSTWKLLPGLYRYWTPPDDRNLEDELRQEFIIRAPSFTDYRPTTSWGWYFLMQHSLAPTRLLDWTESALIALFFAIRENKGGSDAAVWALEPWKLNQHSVKEEEVLCPEITGAFSEERLAKYQKWLPTLYDAEPEIPSDPMAIYPAYSAQRISTQRSCFTLHGTDPFPFERTPYNNQHILRKFVVKATAIPQIKQQLITCGLDEISIFPDLDGLGRNLYSVLRMETDKQ
jgi:FRG domain